MGLALASLRHWGGDFVAAHRVLAREAGVDLGRISTRRNFQMPWSYHLPTRYLLAGEVDFATEMPDGHQFAGPMIRKARRDETVDDAALQEYFAPPGGSDADRRIYAAFGSMRQPPAHFLSALYAVADANPAWRFLIANLDEAARAGPAPGNVARVGWAPQLAALEAADCAIFHGGAGTLNECLATATPMLVYPNALDGPGNGARIVTHGLGRVGSYDDGEAKISSDLRALLDDADVRTRLDRMCGTVQGYARDAVLERAVEAALSAREAP